MPAPKVICKQCVVCGESKLFEDFYKHKNGRYGYASKCKICVSNKNKNPKSPRNILWRKQAVLFTLGKHLCSTCGIIKDVELFATTNDGRYNLRNQCKHCRRDRKIKFTSIDICDKIENTYAPEESEYGNLQVKCKYCSDYFEPTYHAFNRNIEAASGVRRGIHSLYCSDECKAQDVDFNRKPNQIKPGESGYEEYAFLRRNIKQRPYQKLFRKGLFELQGKPHYCNSCNKIYEGTKLIAHHKIPVIYAPKLKSDLNNGELLCFECHEERHQTPGFTYEELRQYAYATGGA